MRGESGAGASLESGSRAAALEDLRRRGVRGGIIARHRAMAGLTLTPRRALAAACAALFALFCVVRGLVFVVSWWEAAFRMGASALGIPGGVGTRVWQVGSWEVGLPLLAVDAAWPGYAGWFAACALCVVVLLATAALPPAVLPVTYFVRALVCLQTSALVYFALARGPFPYRLGDYAVGLLASGIVVILFVPLLFGCTYYLTDVPWPRKAFLTFATVAHLAVFLPAKVLLHAYLIHRLTHLVTPVLFFGFGVLLDIFVVVAFYSWGMSWPSPGGDTQPSAPAVAP